MGIAGTNDEGLMAFAARQKLRLLIWAGLFAISGGGFLLQGKSEWLSQQTHQ